MLIVSVVISGLTVRTRAQAEAAQHREQQTAALYAMSRELAGTRGVDALLQVAVRHVTEVFRSQVVVLLPDAGGSLTAWPGGQFEVDANELGVGRWVYEHRQPAGLGTATLPGASALYVPLIGSTGPVGVLGLRPADRHAMDEPERLHQLETFAAQTALALERARLAEEAQSAQVRVETERLRNSLLSSVSHDLRTPLAAITGAVSTILQDGARARRRHAARAAGIGARGGRAAEPAGPEPPGDDAPRVGRRAAAQGAAPAGGDHRRGARTHEQAAWPAGG